MKRVAWKWYEENVERQVRCWRETLGTKDLLGGEIPQKCFIPINGFQGYYETLCYDAEINPAGVAIVINEIGRRVRCLKSELQPAMPKRTIFWDDRGEVEWWGIELENEK